ncbi:MAG: zinc ribbon domain-containing protein [Phycisphaerae bacterium]|jgi:hypothetical protein
MDYPCRRCQVANPEQARFCRQCGLALQMGPEGFLGPGRVRHPQPLAAPEGFEPVTAAADVYFRCRGAWGERPLLGTEPLVVRVVNVGYVLADVRLHIRGEDGPGAAVLSAEREVALLPRGQEVELEIPSWELHGPVRRLTVTLMSAAFGTEE